MHIEFELTFSGRLADRIEAECARRGCSPADLVAEIIETVIEDDLFAAVIDQ